jgi:hypothetical protein
LYALFCFLNIEAKEGIKAFIFIDNKLEGFGVLSCATVLAGLILYGLYAGQTSCLLMMMRIVVYRAVCTTV